MYIKLTYYLVKIAKEITEERMNSNAYSAHFLLKSDLHHQTLHPMVIIIYAMIDTRVPHGSPKITS